MLAFAYNGFGRSSLLTADFGRGIDNLKKGIPIAEKLGNLEEAGYSTGFLGMIYSSIGEFDTGMAHIERAVSIAQGIRNLTREAQALFLIGVCQGLRGNWKTVLAVLESNIEMALEIGDAVTAGAGMAWKGHATFMTGNREGGVASMREAIEFLQETGTRILFSLINGWLAESHALMGSPKEANQFAEKSFQEIERGERWGETIAIRALAMAAALETHPDWNRVEAHMQESLRLAEERGERPQLAIGCFRYAELLKQKGDSARAREQVVQATALLSEMEMPWWLEQAEELGKRLAG